MSGDPAVSDLGVGDSDLPYMVVAPADSDTTATLTVRAPDGTTTPVGATGGLLEAIPDTSPATYQQQWTADVPVVYTLPGRWVLHWTVTGTGEGAEDHEVWVSASPLGSGPAWIPGRSRVAAYVPHRTITADPASTTGSQDTYAMTFTDTTRPTGRFVDMLIADAAAVLQARVRPMHPSSEGAAATVTAVWAAAAVERGWPEDSEALQRANDLEKRADTLLAGLVASNDLANAGDGDPETVDVVYPVFSFPPADPRYDSARYW